MWRGSQNQTQCGFGLANSQIKELDLEGFLALGQIKQGMDT